MDSPPTAPTHAGNLGDLLLAEYRTTTPSTSLHVPGCPCENEVEGRAERRGEGKEEERRGGEGESETGREVGGGGGGAEALQCR